MSDYVENYFDKKNPEETAKADTLKEEFFTKTGLGSKLRLEYERIMKNLTLPKFVQDIFNKPEDQLNMDDNLVKVIKSLSENFNSSQILILPSFFKFLVYLKKQKIEFALVIRTFGQDLPLIVNELSQYVNQFLQWQSSLVQWIQQYSANQVRHRQECKELQGE